jgi:hypothetical protein
MLHSLAASRPVRFSEVLGRLSMLATSRSQSTQATEQNNHLRGTFNKALQGRTPPLIPTFDAGDGTMNQTQALMEHTGNRACPVGLPWGH